MALLEEMSLQEIIKEREGYNHNQKPQESDTHTTVAENKLFVTKKAMVN